MYFSTFRIIQPLQRCVGPVTFAGEKTTSGPAIPDAFDLSTMLRDLNVDSNTHCAYSLKVDAIIE